MIHGGHVVSWRLRPGSRNAPTGSGGPRTRRQLLHIRMLEFPLPAGPFVPLSGSITLHVRSGGVIHQGKFEQCAKYKTLANLSKYISFNGYILMHNTNWIWILFQSLQNIEFEKYFLCIHPLQTSYVLLLAYHIVLRELFREKIPYPTCTRKKRNHISSLLTLSTEAITEM